MEKLQFEFAIAAGEDEKSDILVITSILTEDGKKYAIPEEFRFIDHHKEIIKSDHFNKIKNSLKKRHQIRKVWISLNEELTKAYTDKDGNIQFAEQYLEEIEEKKTEDKSQNENLSKILEKFVEATQKKKNQQNLKLISDKFLIEKFASKNPNAKQWMQNFEKECTRFDITEDETKIEILRLFLDISCLDWYSSMAAKLTVNSEWKEWKEKFFKTFAKSGWDMVTYAFAYKYTEGLLIDYAMKKERLLLNTNRHMDSKTLIDLIAIGLPDFILNEINRDELNDSTDLFREIRKYEDMSKNANGTSDLEPEERVPILPLNEKAFKRLGFLVGDFKKRYNTVPSYFVKVPGRVNLIGEHIDYCGYGVCPMAIEQHIIIAVAPTLNNTITISNVEPKYGSFVCTRHQLDDVLKRNGSEVTWYKYFLCGVKGALEAMPKEHTPMGFSAVVWGNIPPNSGLASSSALVSAALLMTMLINKQPLSKPELATHSANAERYIGTMGGGMDQAVAFLGKQGSAMLIEFNPLRSTDITLPETAAFVIAHSQTCHNKASTGNYNLRVMECRFAALLIANKRSMPLEQARTLSDVQHFLGASLEEMVSIVLEDLHEQSYNMNEICQILGVTRDRLVHLSVGQLYISETFKLRQRALHVFQEAARVLEFRRVSEDSSMMEEQKIRLLGDLMCKSHESLRKLYECSASSVDALVEKAMSYGALGARLTGAGWGGCIVALTTRNKFQKLVEALTPDPLKRGMNAEVQHTQPAFPTVPNQGAVIYTM